jgi:PTH1 family peptidyl-tRNA hydrolase
MGASWAVVGLGNPGTRYAYTRHNVGFWVADELASLLKCSFNQEKFGCQIARSEELLLVKPQKYMNLSGEALAPLVRFFKIEAENVVVIHDDVDLKTGALVVKKGGGSGGQHGVEDIVRHLNSADFYRIRIGVGRAPGSLPGQDLSSWVLSEPKGQERSTLEITTKDAAKCALTLIRDGLEAARQGFVRRSFPSV